MSTNHIVSVLLLLCLQFGAKCGLVAMLVSAVFTASSPLMEELGAKRILVLLPTQTPSHYPLISALTDELLARGHNVTYVTARPLHNKHPHLREILVENVFQSSLRNYIESFFGKKYTSFEMTYFFYIRGINQSRSILQNPQALAVKNESFDLVISEAFYGQESLLAFAHHFGCPSMVINPVGFHLELYKATGSSMNPAYVACYAHGISKKVDTFLDRLYNTLTFLFALMLYHFYYYPQANSLMHEAFPDAPPLYDLIDNISLTLSNSNPVFSFPVPTPPSVISVGGLHIKPGKSLSEELRKWIEDSEHGVVYFSLGANLIAGLLPADKKEAIISSFGKLKQRVLLKWNGEIPANSPANCRFEEWVPQQDVLAHPNLVLFVTHGGLLGAHEAVYFGVPLIGVPVFGDQFQNMEIAAEKGMGKFVPLHKLTSKALDAMLDEVITHPKYRENSKRLSVIFRSDPITPLESAVYHTELLMKLGDFKHLQSASLHLCWYQYLLLDVMASLAVSAYLTWHIMCYLRKRLVILIMTKLKKKKD